MAKNKSQEGRRPASRLAWIRVLWRPHNRGLVLSAIVAVAALGLMSYAWQRWGRSGIRAADYLVTPDRILVSPQPGWIRSDVKAEVLRTAGYTALDIRDRSVLDKISRAFALHPWVASVSRVQKSFPPQLHVELKYRRPVAVVEVAPLGKSGLLFIDEESVLLPSADFTPEQAKDYLRIAGANEAAAGVFGMPWGSKKVTGAARLAALWANRWQPLGLYRITASESRAAYLTYELRTKGDVKVLWGQPPGGESSAEPAPEDKIAALERYVQSHGPLDREGGPPVIDLVALAQPVAKTAERGKSSPR